MRISDWSSDVCSSDLPIDELVDERTAAIFELGLSNLSMSPTGFPEAKTLERFEAGLIDLYRRAGLFVENPAAVENTEGVLYRARIPVPARVPVGTHREIGRASGRERVGQ